VPAAGNIHMGFSCHIQQSNSHVQRQWLRCMDTRSLFVGLLDACMVHHRPTHCSVSNMHQQHDFCC
jgi:hypothetical protein